MEPYSPSIFYASRSHQLQEAWSKSSHLCRTANHPYRGIKPMRPAMNKSPSFPILLSFLLFICSSAVFARGEVWSRKSTNATRSLMLLAPQKPPNGRPPKEKKEDDDDDEEEGDRKISQAEVRELEVSVEQILQFVSKDTDLPVKHRVRKRLLNRKQVVARIQQRLAQDAEAQKMLRSEPLLKKLGLLPREFDLHAFLIASLQAEVEAFYDPNTSAVNLLNWVPPKQQSPVLAHELTHALQDQSFNLRKWKNFPVGRIEADEASVAREAVLEGQATSVLGDYMLSPSGTRLLDSPKMLAAMKAGILASGSGSSQFQNAPLYVREALTFRYRFGVDFTEQLLRSGGKEKAFAGALLAPPTTTRQIMEPATYLSGEHLAILPMPDFAHDFEPYTWSDSGAFGEFDTALLIEQYAGMEASNNLYPHWRGGYYYAAKANADVPLALLYVSRWSDPEAAAKFGAVYTQAIARRYKNVQEMSGDKVAEPARDERRPAAVWKTFITEDGPVVIQISGNAVVISEGLDEQKALRLAQKIFVPAGKKE
jgi:hypothetical protein